MCESRAERTVIGERRYRWYGQNFTVINFITSTLRHLILGSLKVQGRDCKELGCRRGGVVGNNGSALDPAVGFQSTEHGNEIWGPIRRRVNWLFRRGEQFH